MKEKEKENLNNEADFAADFIEEILNIADLEGDIEMGIKNDRPYVQIVTENKEELNDMIGEKGEGLLALQEITRLAVLNQTRERTELLVDINGWRDDLLEKTKKQIDEAKEEIEKGAEQVELKPMNSYDRKNAHDYVFQIGLFSFSKGEGKERRVVVTKEETTKE